MGVFSACPPSPPPPPCLPPSLQDVAEQTSTVVVRNAGLCQRVGEEEAQNHVFSLKIFLNRWAPNLLRDAVQTSKECSGTSLIRIST